ncbi:MAG: 1,6-anhydro-N-acetylmuramyl-L-alanine amidase AmpD [Betaproteobacteria bacterium]|nr:1,6-anhydro-N-acetylmuramyl-L-alanine amidase AmpD [Betaproteobacteria bacterium]
MRAVPGDLLDSGGLLPGVRYAPSPNCDDRPAGEIISLVVIHAISLPPGEFGGDAIERLFTNCLDPAEHPYYPEIYALRVSAHFLIRRDGALIQFVPCHRRAWHAGLSNWRGRDRCNDFSIGIELEGCDEMSFEDAQYHALARLLRVLKRSYPLTDIAGHAEIAPGRKTDPGPKFDWTRVAGFDAGK